MIKVTVTGPRAVYEITETDLNEEALTMASNKYTNSLKRGLIHPTFTIEARRRKDDTTDELKHE